MTVPHQTQSTLNGSPKLTGLLMNRQIGSDVSGSCSYFGHICTHICTYRFRLIPITHMNYAASGRCLAGTLHSDADGVQNWPNCIARKLMETE